MSQQSAIIQLQGKQHIVVVGDVLVIDRLETAEVGKKLEVTDVLLTTDGTKTEVGTPLLKGAKVTFEVIEHAKGDKIRVFKYKSKSKYRKTNGHRQLQTTLKVVTIA